MQFSLIYNQRANDQAVVAHDAFDLEFMLNRLDECYKNWGLNITSAKQINLQ